MAAAGAIARMSRVFGWRMIIIDAGKSGKLSPESGADRGGDVIHSVDAE
jgi:hypothetical protein